MGWSFRQVPRLSIPGLTDYEGLGISYATDSAREQLRPGDDAVDVGGANSAGQLPRPPHFAVPAESVPAPTEVEGAYRRLAP